MANLFWKYLVNKSKIICFCLKISTENEMIMWSRRLLFSVYELIWNSTIIPLMFIVTVQAIRWSSLSVLELESFRELMMSALSSVMLFSPNFSCRRVLISWFSCLTLTIFDTCKSWTSDSILWFRHSTLLSFHYTYHVNHQNLCLAALFLWLNHLLWWDNLSRPLYTFFFYICTDQNRTEHWNSLLYLSRLHLF